MRRKFIHTVIGIFGDNQQPWMEHVKAETPQDAARAGIKKIDKRNDEAVGIADIFVVDVIKGKVKGCLCNEKVVDIDDLD